LSGSTDGSSGFGRTGWDVLHGGRLAISVSLLIIAVLALLVLGADFVLGTISYIGSFVRQNWYYSIPLVSGFLLYRFVYLRYNMSVILQVQGEVPEEYEVSRGCFTRMEVKEGALYPESTKDGRLLYRVRSVDFENNVITMGWQHGPETSLSHILAIKEDYYGLLDSYHKAEVERYRLLDHGRTDALRTGHEYTTAVLDIMDDLAFGGRDASVQAPVNQEESDES